MRALPKALAVALLALAVVPVHTSSASTDCPAVPSSVLASSMQSPYLGHIGSNNGSGSDILAGGWPGKLAQLQKEAEMGLRWTFLPVHWSLIEPAQPTAPPPAPVARGSETDDSWLSLDRFVRAAHDLGLNPYLQIVVGGNAGRPPAWAGQRDETRSAPIFMDGTEPGANGEGLVPFAAKLAQRFRPGGTLASADGWTDGFGVRTWLIDNEPESYTGAGGTNWDTQADDYAEFVVKAAAQIKAADPSALIVAPESAEGDKSRPWTSATLQWGVQQASDDYEQRVPFQDYVIGPSVDVASLHSYEVLGLVFHNALLDGDDLSAQQVLRNYRSLKAKFAEYENQPGASYAPKTRFWHTEGDFNFGPGDPQNKKHWIVQWLTQGLAAGIEKMTVMDPSDDEAISVHTLTCLLPNPFPIADVTAAVGANPADVKVFRVVRAGDGGWTYVAYARPGAGNLFGQTITLPVQTSSVSRVSWSGSVTPLTAPGGAVTVQLPSGGLPFNEHIYVVDGAPGQTLKSKKPKKELPDGIWR